MHPLLHAWEKQVLVQCDPYVFTAKSKNVVKHCDKKRYIACFSFEYSQIIHISTFIIIKYLQIYILAQFVLWCCFRPRLLYPSV